MAAGAGDLSDGGQHQLCTRTAIILGIGVAEERLDPQPESNPGHSALFTRQAVPIFRFMPMRFQVIPKRPGFSVEMVRADGSRAVVCTYGTEAAALSRMRQLTQRIADAETTRPKPAEKDGGH